MPGKVHMNQEIVLQTGPYVAVSIGEGLIPEGNGLYGTPMSDDYGITIFEVVHKDGSTEFRTEFNAPATSVQG